MNVLVVAAHPDDEVLGCGGTMARLARDGHDVHVLIVGEGVTSRSGKTSAITARELSKLRDDAHRAAEVLGVRTLSMLGLPDNRLDTVPLLDVIKPIEDRVEQLRPRIVFTQSGGDLNIDHAVVFRATLTATRPLAGCSVRELYAYEVASSSEWAFGQFASQFAANLFVDISATLDLKIAAMCCYEGESRTFPHPRSAEALRAAAARWGSVVGVTSAEAFSVVRKIDL